MIKTLPKLAVSVVMVSPMEASKPIKNSAHQSTTIDLAIVTTFEKSEMWYSKAAIFKVGFKFADFVLARLLFLQAAKKPLGQQRFTLFVTVSPHYYLKLQVLKLVRQQISLSTLFYFSYFFAACFLEVMSTLELEV